MLAAESIVSNTLIIYFFLFVDITMADEVLTLMCNIRKKLCNMKMDHHLSGFRSDAPSKVFSAEQNGRARGVGGGVPPTSLKYFHNRNGVITKGMKRCTI